MRQIRGLEKGDSNIFSFGYPLSSPFTSLGVHLTGVHLTGVHLTGVHLTAMHLSSQACISQPSISQPSISQPCISAHAVLPIAEAVESRASRASRARGVTADPRCYRGRRGYGVLLASSSIAVTQCSHRGRLRRAIRPNDSFLLSSSYPTPKCSPTSSPPFQCLLIMTLMRVPGPPRFNRVRLFLRLLSATILHLN
jgi:hypothetical protein